MLSTTCQAPCQNVGISPQSISSLLALPLLLPSRFPFCLSFSSLMVPFRSNNLPLARYASCHVSTGDGCVLFWGTWAWYVGFKDLGLFSLILGCSCTFLVAAWLFFWSRELSGSSRLMDFVWTGASGFADAQPRQVGVVLTSPTWFVADQQQCCYSFCSRSR